MALVFQKTTCMQRAYIGDPFGSSNALMDEGIDGFEDLVPYKDEDIIHLVNNCRKTHRAAQPGPAASAAALAAWNICYSS
jgi:hypothetical protein